MSSEPANLLDRQSDNAGVMFPPPFLYLIPIVGGIVVDRFWPLPIAASAALEAVGWLLIGAWIWLTGFNVARFLLAGTSLLPYRPASTLILTGSYRFTRNPMYLGFAFFTIAVGLLAGTYWPLVLLPPTLYLVQTWVIEPEERYLRRRFGAEYDAYTRRVRRWL
jgi:protein-S-isoprenylcysteine O-methyltransferase Ste14